jgi:8-amino-7-oxononanoate synthase
VVASTLKALEHAEADRTLRPRLQANAERLFRGLNALGFTTGPKPSPIVAVVMPDLPTALGMWNALLAGGVYLNLALPPATPNNRPLLRTSISAAHTPEQIDHVLDVFEWVGRELGVLPAAGQRASG